MKLRNTVFLVLAVVLLWGYLAFFDSKIPTTRESLQKQVQVVDFDPARIEKIRLSNNEERIEVVKRHGNWMLEAPIKDKADSSLVESLLGTVLALRPNAVINDTKNDTDIKPFGVSKSNTRLQLFGDGAPPEILFGKNAAVEGQIYLGLAKSKRVFVVPVQLKNLVTKKVDDFRDTQMVEINPEQVDQVTIQSGSGEIELQKGSGHWQITKPIRARANNELINTLIAQITKLKAKGFISEKEMGRLTEPMGTVSLYTPASKQPLRLSLGEVPDLADQVYAKLSTRTSVFLLDKIVGGLFKAKPNDLRDRHLLRLNLDMVDRITITPAAKPKLIISRKSEIWVGKDAELDQAKMNSFLNHLLNQKVVSFISDTGSELDKYGLQNPLVRITFSSYASENTAESNAGERPIVSLSLGRLENGEIFAKLDEEPFVVTIDQALLDKLPVPLPQSPPVSDSTPQPEAK